MAINENSLLQIISLIVVIALALYKNPTTTTIDLVIFSSIMLLAVLLISINWVQEKTKKIDENTKSIRMLESKVNLREDMKLLSDRIAKIEGWKEATDKPIKNKRGQLIDPKTLILILIVILIVLYLRSQGQ